MTKVVVIPAYNEAASIVQLVKACLANGADRVVVADDASTDDTAALASLAGADVVAVPPARDGLVAVYQTGAKRALELGAEMIVEVDAGGSHDPRALPLFWAALAAYDVAAGTRLGVGGLYDSKRSRRWLSRLGTLVTNFIHRANWTDATSGFIGYRREVGQFLTSYAWRSRGHFYQTELRILVRGKYQCCETPIEYVGGRSSLRTSAVFEAARLTFLYARKKYGIRRRLSKSSRHDILSA